MLDLPLFVLTIFVIPWYVGAYFSMKWNSPSSHSRTGNKFKIVHNLNDDGSGTCDYDYWQKITINRLVFRRKDEKYKRIFTITEADIVNWMIQDEQERDVQIKSNIVIDPELMNMYWDPVTHEIKDEGVHILPSVWIQEYELIKN